jgi:hypothetical protein
MQSCPEKHNHFSGSLVVFFVEMLFNEANGKAVWNIPFRCLDGLLGKINITGCVHVREKMFFDRF